VIFTTKEASFTLVISWPFLSHATCDWILAADAARSITNLGSFNFAIPLRISAAWAAIVSRGSAPFGACNSTGNQMSALATALTGYIPNPRCYAEISRVAGEVANERTSIAYVMVSMGLDLGSTSDRHCTSNPTTISTLVTLGCPVLFAT